MIINTERLYAAFYVNINEVFERLEDDYEDESNSLQVKRLGSIDKTGIKLLDPKHQHHTTFNAYASVTVLRLSE